MATPSSTESRAPGTLRIHSVEWADPRAVALRDAMAAELHGRYAEWIAAAAKDGDGDALADDIDPGIVAHTVIAELDGEPVGHATLIRSRAPAHAGELEVKRVFSDDRIRRRGVSKALLTALETWAAEQGAPRVILATGPKQPEAVALYRRTGYTAIPSFAPEPWTAHVFCFEKRLGVVSAGPAG
ncbi:GNAT family N-acetyltransferase [Patulibacter sp. NPDC049589]|uniref:GNAT family N-acetyltransferase n=1 Tax=Patulibacter sp. NPDC049589 TaxID=3154731 RepID=UPI003441EADD